MILAILLSLWLAVAAMAGSARSGKDGHAGKGMGFLKGLNLTADQKTRVQAVMDKYRSEMQASRQKMATARDEVGTVIHAATFDEAAIRKAAGNAAAIREDMIVLRARIFSEIRPILTAEQIAQMDAQRTQRIEKMKQRVGAEEPESDL